MENNRKNLEIQEVAQIKKQMSKYSNEFIEYFINHMQSIILSAYDEDTTLEEQIFYIVECKSVTYDTQESVNNLLRFRTDINNLAEENEEIKSKLYLFFSNPELLEVIILQELFYMYIKQYDID